VSKPVTPSTIVNAHYKLWRKSGFEGSKFGFALQVIHAADNGVETTPDLIAACRRWAANPDVLLRYALTNNTDHLPVCEPVHPAARQQVAAIEREAIRAMRGGVA